MKHLLSAVGLGAFCCLISSANAEPATKPAIPEMGLQGLTSLGQLGKITINPLAPKAESPTGNVPGSTVNAPPLNGFNPQVVFGLTTEQDKNGTLDFYAAPSNQPAHLAASFTMPFAATPRYLVATFDTGSQSHLITSSAYNQFDVVGANRAGAYQQPIEGVSGEEDTDISDALGIYATGFSNSSINASGSIAVTSGTLKGQWNIPILSTEPGSALPNLVGAPMAAHYQTAILNSQTRHLTVGSTTYRSPNVVFQPLGTAPPGNYSKLTLNVQSVNGVTPDPAYIPSLDNFNNFADDPTTPGFWASFTATATATHTAGTSGAQDFLFDTGADVSVVSEDTAASVGFYTGGDTPSTPDFYINVDGVGGTSTQVPGFYMNQLTVTTNGGPITWTHVPVLVLNIPDPRDGVGFIPGVLGMNLFTDRDIIINGGTANPYVAIGPQIVPQWTAATGGTWGDDSKWSLGSPDGADRQANFLSTITAPSVVSVDSVGFTIGSMKFDSAFSYTIAGPGTINFQAYSTGQATINVVSGSHAISAPINLQSDTTITVTPSTSVLTISGDVNGGSVALTKAGAGTVVMKNIRAGALSINQGTIAVATNGTTTGTSKVATLLIAGGATPTATLDLDNNSMVVTTGSYSAISNDIAYARHGSAWDRPGITSAAARNASPMIYSLGAITGAEFAGVFGSNAPFEGQSVAPGSVLIRYTYTGDADLNGQVDGDDYSRIDSGFRTGGSDWFHGDFDYNGKVDGADYALIDAAFSQQGNRLAQAIAYLDGQDPSQSGMNDPALQMVVEHFDEFGETYAGAFLAAIPEPSSMIILASMVLALASRRRSDRILHS